MNLINSGSTTSVAFSGFADEITDQESLTHWYDLGSLIFIYGEVGAQFEGSPDGPLTLINLPSKAKYNFQLNITSIEGLRGSTYSYPGSQITCRCIAGTNTAQFYIFTNEDGGSGYLNREEPLTTNYASVVDNPVIIRFNGFYATK